MKNDYVEQVCVVGLGNPQPMALFNLSEIGQKENKQNVEESLLQSIAAVNEKRANFERISTAIIQSEAWSEANDVITPTLKVKRGNIDDKFGQDYLKWHEAQDKVIWQ